MLNKQEIDLHLSTLIDINKTTIFGYNEYLKEVEVVVEPKIDIYLLLTLKDDTRVFIKYKFISVEYVKDLEYLVLSLFSIIKNITYQIVNKKYTLWERLLGKHRKKDDYVIIFVTKF